MSLALSKVGKDDANYQDADGDTMKEPLQDQHKFCKKEIVESYNLNGYKSPRMLNFYLCPAMKLSCCSMYDQFMMFSNWRENIKPKLEEYYTGIENKMKRIKDLLKEISKFKFKEIIEKMRVEQKQKDKILQQHMLLKDKDLIKLTDQVTQLYFPNKEFMIQFRSTFYCNICDFSSHQHIDVERKILKIGEASCGELAMNTINFSYFLNVELSKYLIDFTRFLLNFSLSDSAEPAKIRRFNKVRKDVAKCANVFKSNGTNFKKCKAYCSYYKMNANSPVIEGYQIFFNHVINAFEVFLKNYKPEDDNKDEDDDDEKSRVLSEKNAKKDSKQDSKQDGKGGDTGNEKRHNDDMESLKLSSDELESVYDPYTEKGVDPNYDEYVMNKMFSFEKNYVRDRHVGYVNFIKNKLHFTDVEYDYETATEDDLFKTNSHDIVDLENFVTKIRGHGVNIEKHLYTTNIDRSLRDLISHLKSRSKYRIMYEKLDPTLMEQINDISNDNVKNYHRDNFLHFKDFSLLLKNEELMNKYDKVKRAGWKKGYRLY